MAQPGRSEDAYGEKLDRCLYNSLIKFVSGVGVGIVCSVLLFKRKPWPMILGAGIGTGMGVSDCNHEFRGTRIQKAVGDSAVQYVTVQVSDGSTKINREKNAILRTVNNQITSEDLPTFIDDDDYN